jgi:hypothetical protein
MIDFIASARTQEEIDKNHCGWTVAEVKLWIKGVEVFVSHFCGIHSQIAMQNELQKFLKMPDDELKEFCMKIVRSSFTQEG